MWWRLLCLPNWILKSTSFDCNSIAESWSMPYYLVHPENLWFRSTPKWQLWVKIIPPWQSNVSAGRWKAKAWHSTSLLLNYELSEAYESWIYHETGSLRGPIQHIWELKDLKSHDTHVLGPLHFIWWIEAKYKPSTHQELCYLNFDLTKWAQEKDCQNC